MKPKLQMLNNDEIKEIYSNALNLLENVGVYFEKAEMLNLFKDEGCNVDFSKKIAYIPQSLIEESLSSVPPNLNLYNREGEKVIELTGNNTIFNPGSAAVNFLDANTNEVRRPKTNDFVDFIRLTDSLKYIEAQSTAMVVNDAPKDIVDRYRLYLVLKNSTKPIITGGFTIEGIHVMKKMLDVVTDGKTKEKPLAIFDCCPSPPLKWSELTSQNLIDCAKYGLPVELISMPLAGATSPVTLASAITQHTAENLSGIVLTQIVKKGAHVIWGGSSTCLDIRQGTTPMGAIEAALINCSYVQIGKYLNLPTHTYLGLSDSKRNDFQAGFESAIGLVMGTLAGANVISGPGMLDFENCQSMEKLLLDNEICGMAKRFSKGVTVSPETIPYELFKEVVHNGDMFLGKKHTLEWYKTELFIPSSVIDRKNKANWEKDGKIGILSRTQKEISRILKEHKPLPLEPDKEKELDKVMMDDLAGSWKDKWIIKKPKEE